MTKDRDLSTRLAFARIDQGTAADLKPLWAMIAPALGGILKRFYAHLQVEPQMAALIGSRQGALESAQVRHWERLFSGKFGSDYAESIDRIGRAHHHIGLEPRWYIGGYQFMLSELARLVLAKHRFASTKAARLIESLNKVVLFDLDLAISTYQQILLEERAARNQQVNAAVETFRLATEGVLQIVDGSARQMQATSRSLTAIAASASDEAVSAAAASEETSVNVQTVASAAEELTHSIQEISRQVGNATTVVRSATGMTEASSADVMRLSDAAQKIGDVVGLIQAIASQTNLLALNATIEAARAGEAGRGFAVVAQEVKQLAAQTSKATDEIAQQIAGIQASTASAVGTIRDVARTMAEIHAVTSSIAGAIEEQDAATREIAASAQMAAQTTRTLSSNVSQVNAGIDQTKDVASEVFTTSSDLGEQSSRLAEEVRHFLHALTGEPEAAAAPGGRRAA
ncbi:globin-coupled sensor protein [Phreatobacter stygius]|uniref:Chemotaxis protein n=1 Tax=Phreatobacter stygius TaxID=1940610 RepID=A0A4D7AYY6_9HYPH|nr:globin-coupled sensor protein [Phreatobacter stygius]QCI63878.1 chemotaxis protein [Phreatobacter stygius]